MSDAPILDNHVLTDISAQLENIPNFVKETRKSSNNNSNNSSVCNSVNSSARNSVKSEIDNWEPVENNRNSDIIVNENIESDFDPLQLLDALEKAEDNLELDLESNSIFTGTTPTNNLNTPRSNNPCGLSTPTTCTNRGSRNNFSLNNKGLKGKSKGFWQNPNSKKVADTEKVKLNSLPSISSSSMAKQVKTQTMELKPNLQEPIKAAPTMQLQSNILEKPSEDQIKSMEDYLSNRTLFRLDDALDRRLAQCHSEIKVTLTDLKSEEAMMDKTVDLALEELICMTDVSYWDLYDLGEQKYYPSAKDVPSLLSDVKTSSNMQNNSVVNMNPNNNMMMNPQMMGMRMNPMMGMGMNPMMMNPAMMQMQIQQQQQMQMMMQQQSMMMQNQNQSQKNLYDKGASGGNDGNSQKASNGAEADTVDKVDNSVKPQQLSNDGAVKFSFGKMKTTGRGNNPDSTMFEGNAVSEKTKNFLKKNEPKGYFDEDGNYHLTETKKSESTESKANNKRKSSRDRNRGRSRSKSRGGRNNRRDSRRRNNRRDSRRRRRDSRRRSRSRGRRDRTNEERGKDRNEERGKERVDKHGRVIPAGRNDSRRRRR